jgi:hypothetical protein
VRVEILFACEL